MLAFPHLNLNLSVFKDMPAFNDEVASNAGMSNMQINDDY